jgi:hypothetical protein
MRNMWKEPEQERAEERDDASGCDSDDNHQQDSTISLRSRLFPLFFLPVFLFLLLLLLNIPHRPLIVCIV